MKSSLPSFALIVAAVLLTGCESTGVSARIQEKPAVFAALTPEQQKIIEVGDIEVGFTADMVYLALGNPSEVQTKDTPEGPVTMWTYNKYFPSKAVRLSMSMNGGMTYSGKPMVGNNAPGGTAATAANTVNSSISLEPPDPTYTTLYVMIFQDRVFEIKLAN